MKYLKYLIKETLCTMFGIVIVFTSLLLLLFVSGITAHAETKTAYQKILASASESDFEALEEVIYNESAVADCDFKVNVAVAETVLNRVSSGEWGKSIYDVCHSKNQFVCKPIPKNVSEHTAEDISDAIEYLINGGTGFLPNGNYVYFATKKQSYAKDHIWIGAMENGKTIKGRGMWFGSIK